MKKLFLVGLVGTLIAACSSRTGELTGVQGRLAYQPQIPLGMVYIPSGSYVMGENDQDVPFLHQTRAKTVSVQAFYIDQTEITNNEYRQFTQWVQDSVMRELVYDAYGQDDPEYAADMLNYKNEYWVPGEAELIEFDPSLIDENRDMFSLNWDRRINFTDMEDPIMQNALVDMYYPDAQRYYKRREIDTRKLNFKYEWVNLRLAASRGDLEIMPDGYDYQAGTKEDGHRDLKPGQEHPFSKDPMGENMDDGTMSAINKLGMHTAKRGHADRSYFIIQEMVNVYPDTLCWVRDFTYSFHDPMTNMYYWHPAYDNYPVVGVSWTQARAFSVWRTQLLNVWLTSMGDLYVNDFRLPNEAEWERAARGDLNNSAYPWGGPYIRNESGCFLGNFKPMRGRYFEDGGFHTVKAFSYNPNGWGLYCMSGNVSEWCETAYDESMYEFSHDLNTEYRYDALDSDPPSRKRKVTRGGSWKDIGYYLMTSTRSYEYQDTAKSFLGFRNVATHLGRGGRDFTKESGEEIRQDIQLK